MTAHANSPRGKRGASDRARADKTAADVSTESNVLPLGPLANAPKRDDAATSKQGATGLQSLLKEHFEPEDDDAIAGPSEAASPASAGGARSPWKGRVVKSVLGVALVVTVGWMPAQRLLQVSSSEAVVNARVVTVRAPIAGVVGANAADLEVGANLKTGMPLVTVSNPRADRDRLSEATDRLERLLEDRAAIDAKLGTLNQLRANLQTQLVTFRDNRIRQIEAQIAEADARIAAAEARQVQARAQQARLASLEGDGVTTTSSLESATSEATVADVTVDQERAARRSLVIERDALKAGTYLGDGYNDQPRSAQRLDEIDETIASLKADAAAGDARIVRAKEDVAREHRSYDLKHEAVLDSPVAGRVWQVLTSPGEQVVAGQELVSLVDCSQTVVTAAVSEAVYNSLSLGSPATFTFREGGAPLEGKVVQLSGMAAASSNFAIVPSALQKQPYRVTVAVANASGKGSCAIGRTGRVVFGPSAR